MKKSMDTLEIAFEEQEESPPASTPMSVGAAGPSGKNKEDDEEEEEEEEEENMDVELTKLRPSGGPSKKAKRQEFLTQFTEEQMRRYEAFRRAGFINDFSMNRFLTSITRRAISKPTVVAMSVVAKMFVGELVETARVVMVERQDTGPIRPCHMREAYRRLKLEGKVPRRSVSRLFR